MLVSTYDQQLACELNGERLVTVHCIVSRLMQTALARRGSLLAVACDNTKLSLTPWKLHNARLANKLTNVCRLPQLELKQ